MHFLNFWQFKKFFFMGTAIVKWNSDEMKIPSYKGVFYVARVMYRSNFYQSIQ